MKNEFFSMKVCPLVTDVTGRRGAVECVPSAH